MERSADTTFQMAPRNEGGKPVENLGDTLPESPERDIEEIEAVNDSLDSLSSALDFIEKRTDDIKAQLLELLNSNREIRQSFINENSKK